MGQSERWREPVASLPTAEDLGKKLEQGWRIVAIEWERESGSGEASDKRPIPYGLRISDDCRHLELDRAEREVISIIIAMIAGDHPLSRIAAELNQRGFRTRRGSEWTQLSLFRLLPRVIELGPEILSEEQWSESKKRLLASVG